MYLINENTDKIQLCNKDLYKGTAVKGVLFDMDGVILDTEKLYTRFWKEACAYFGFEMTHDMALGMRSLNSALGESKLKEYFGDTVDYLLVRNKRIELMTAFINENGVELKSGVHEVLAFLKENGIKKAIATSSPLERTQDYLSKVGVIDEFDKLISARMVERGKPEPDVYLYAASQLGLKPEECLVIEDSPTGLLAGNRAGCIPVMVPDQDQPSQETKELAYAVVDSLEDLRRIFR